MLMINVLTTSKKMTDYDSSVIVVASEVVVCIADNDGSEQCYMVVW